MAAKLQLPDVTLLSVTAVDIEETHAALLHCAGCADFAAVKMLSSVPPAITDPGVEYIRIPPIDLRGYSRFILESLSPYVQTGFCLIVQSDGFIVDAAHWRDEFLDYDYVGAPWPRYVVPPRGSGRLLVRLSKNFVGNGGFSLRSKRLLEVASRIRFDELEFPVAPEDLLICHHLYDEIRAAGIRFAPPEIAARFSIESPARLFGQSIDSVFGFHGRYWRDACRAKCHMPPRTGAPRKSLQDYPQLSLLNAILPPIGRLKS